MNDDLIRRQAAIDALNKLDVSDGIGISSVACSLQEEAIHNIENLPSAHSWIPTTEKLPEEWESVLLCFKEGKTCTHLRYQVGCLGMYHIEDNNFVITEYKKGWYINHCYYDFDEVKVIAWMPFPDYEE